jgi:hypothetical protein
MDKLADFFWNMVNSAMEDREVPRRNYPESHTRAHRGQSHNIFHPARLRVYGSDAEFMFLVKYPV